MYVYDTPQEDKINLETRGVFTVTKNKFRTDQKTVLDTQTFTAV